MRFNPTSIGLIHLIGIGGIGMSGIAEVLNKLGCLVQGSDVNENSNVKRLRKLGIKVLIGHKESNIENVSLLIVSTAISKNNIEVLYANKLSLPVIHRSEMLAELMRLKPSIVVSGTHGKTTTTSMLADLLDKCEFDPTVISGGVIHSYGTNARVGLGEWMVVEADESDGSFIKLPATIAVVTNIDHEHMDHYGSFAELEKSFLIFIQNIPFYGLGVLCIDDKNVKKLFSNFSGRRIITYGFDETADIRAVNVRILSNKVMFDIEFSDFGVNWLKEKSKDDKNITSLKDISFPMFGIHNIQNALAALAVGIELGSDKKLLVNGLSNFSGVNRRFTHVGTINGISIIDDYAHHPTEIDSVLKSTKLFQKGKIIVIIQPHRYSRLRSLFKEFSCCFHNADTVIVTPVYSAGEEPIVGVDNYCLVAEIKKEGHKDVLAINNKKELLLKIFNIAQKGDMVLFLGAGDITDWAYEISEELSRCVKRREINEAS